MAGNPSVTHARTDARTHARMHARTLTLIQVNIRTEGQGKNILPRSGAEAGHKKIMGPGLEYLVAVLKC